VVVAAVALLPSALANAQPPGTDAPPTGSSVPAPKDRSTTTTTVPPGSSHAPSTTDPSTTAPPDTALAAAQAQRSTTSGPARTTSTTTTTIAAQASGTWITAPGYNPEWHSINAPWVPRPPPDSGSGRRIVYSMYQQRVWLMEDNGYITNTHLVSGRLGLPGFGVYHVYSKSLSTFATHNPSITWNYMVRFAVGPQGGGIGLHEIPWQYGHPVQTVEQLGQPLSGGCLRQTHDDAVLVWNWAPIGTPVIVVP
jgi:hypothetical protein